MAHSPGSREDHDADGGTVAEAEPVAAADGGDQPLGLIEGDFRGLALDHLIAFAADAGRRVEHHEVPGNEEVEETAEGGQVELAGGGTAGVLVEVRRRAGGGDLVQGDLSRLHPGEETASGMQDRPRMGIAEAGDEELLPGVASRRPRGGDHARCHVSRRQGGPVGVGNLEVAALAFASRSCRREDSAPAGMRSSDAILHYPSSSAPPIEGCYFRTQVAVK